MYRFYRDDYEYPDEELLSEEDSFDDFIEHLDYLARLIKRSGGRYNMHGYYVYFYDDYLFHINQDGDILWRVE